MMGRRVREWPRLVAAVAVAAVALVLIGVVVASASSGGTKTVSAKQTAVVTPAPKAAVPKPAASNADKQRIARLQAQLKRQSTQLTAARHALSTSIARTHCWRNKANNPAKKRSVHCPTGSLTQ
jgi:negative regulator of sigma E activity